MGRMASMFEVVAAPPPSGLTQTDTPVDIHIVGRAEVHVKREDLATPYPGPPFSKVRGIAAHLAARPQYTTIGVLDTFHSQGGWGVAYVAQALGRRCVVFYPQYRGEAGPREYQRNAAALGAELRPLPAGRSAVLYHTAKKLLGDYPHAYMMPNALKLPESVTETAAEVARCTTLWHLPLWVVSASSGTLAAGVLCGLHQVRSRAQLVVHLGYSRPATAVRSYLATAAGCYPDLAIVDEGYGYRDAVSDPAPFPCNPYYDRKAWQWLVKHAQALPRTVVLWNIG